MQQNSRRARWPLAATSRQGFSYESCTVRPASRRGPLLSQRPEPIRVAHSLSEPERSRRDKEPAQTRSRRKVTFITHDNRVQPVGSVACSSCSCSACHGPAGRYRRVKHRAEVGSQFARPCSHRGMRLPNAEHACVDREKLTDYLLCVSHPGGGSKAEFFARFGFRVEDWEVLAEALRRHGAHCDVVNTALCCRRSA